ncbi:hypothetical protein [Humidisolicoccus flavus]|uniref:hypothetical protein n=1 Tax=Humidisolicoccus flavus TaxID=3111414 RepID=UPI00324E8B5C
MQPRQRSRFLLALTASCSALLLASCTPTSSDPGPSNSPTTEATKPLPSATAALTLEEEAIATYESFLVATINLETADNPAVSELTSFTSPDVAALEVQEILDRRERGERVEGSVTVDSGLIVEGSVEDLHGIVGHFCLDLTEWQLVDSAGSKKNSNVRALTEVSFFRESTHGVLKIDALGNPTQSELPCAL